MVLFVLGDLNRQNNEGRSLFDKGSTNRVKRGAKRVTKEFLNNTTTSLEYFLLSITVTFVVGDGPLISINQICSVDISSSVFY